MRIVGLIAAIILGCFFIWMGLKEDKSIVSSDKPLIKIGTTLPLTGNMAHIGVSAQQAMQMALEKWNRQDTKFRYELVIEDDGFDAKKVAMNINKMVNVDKVQGCLRCFQLVQTWQAQ